ncbi:MAG: hypothetical protein NZT92_08680 [Abditibacteriales bacterium]|nr:hypothetical protein [Abditibacteriales bacterium]
MTFKTISTRRARSAKRKSLFLGNLSHFERTGQPCAGRHHPPRLGKLGNGETRETFLWGQAQSVGVPLLVKEGLGEVKVPRLDKEGLGEVKIPRLTKEGSGEVKVPLLTKEGLGEVKVPLLDKEGSGEVKVPLLGKEGLAEVTYHEVTAHDAVDVTVNHEGTLFVAPRPAPSDAPQGTSARAGTSEPTKATGRESQRRRRRSLEALRKEAQRRLAQARRTGKSKPSGRTTAASSKGKPYTFIKRSGSGGVSATLVVQWTPDLITPSYACSTSGNVAGSGLRQTN